MQVCYINWIKEKNYRIISVDTKKKKKSDKIQIQVLEYLKPLGILKFIKHVYENPTIKLHAAMKDLIASLWDQKQGKNARFQANNLYPDYIQNAYNSKLRRQPNF